MADDEQIDEVALGALLAEGIDVPTAIAGSIVDPPQPRPKQSGSTAMVIAIVAGLLLGLLLALHWG